VRIISTESTQNLPIASQDSRRGVRELNSSTGEVASGASVWPSLRLHVATASEEGAYTYSISGISVWRKGRRES
jgi:hypothetical protein